MKKIKSDRKLALNTETVRHLKGLATRDLQGVHGGLDPLEGGGSSACTGYFGCTSLSN